MDLITKGNFIETTVCVIKIFIMKCYAEEKLIYYDNGIKYSVIKLNPNTS